MKKLTLVIAVLLSACQVPTSGALAREAKRKTQVDVSLGAIAVGEALFADNCAVCHGEAGKGGAIYSGSIQDATEVADILNTGRGKMPKFNGFSADDVAALQAYLSGKDPGIVTQATETATALVDPLEFFDKSCAKCHGPDGWGTENAPVIQHPIMGYSEWVIRNGRKQDGWSRSMPAFGEDKLSDDAIKVILDWLASGDMPQSGAGLFYNFCSNCHGVDATTGVAAVDLPSMAKDGESDLRAVVRKGQGGQKYANRTGYMPAFSRNRLSDAELTKILDYLKTL